MKTFQITNWWLGTVIAEREAASLKDAVAALVEAGANLSDADLRGAEIPIVENLHTKMLEAIGKGGHLSMGAWDSETDSPHVFLDDNLFEFQPLINSADVLVSYNGISFDNNLLRANGFNIEDAKCYDLLAEIWKAVGLAPTFQYPSHIGYGLGDVCQLNFGRGKTGDGAKAPILFQKGKLGAVIDYCLQDVSLTKQLFDLSQSGEVLNPKNGSPLKLRNL